MLSCGLAFPACRHIPFDLLRGSLGRGGASLDSGGRLPYPALLELVGRWWLVAFVRVPLWGLHLARGASIALASMMRATFAVFMHLYDLIFLALQSALTRIVITELGSQSHLW